MTFGVKMNICLSFDPFDRDFHLSFRRELGSCIGANRTRWWSRWGCHTTDSQSAFVRWKSYGHESKNGSKLRKNRSQTTPCCKPQKYIQEVEKYDVFATCFSPIFGGWGDERVYSVLFFRLKKKAPPVNLNLSWLMPSGWSRPLHLRCGRISGNH